MEATTKSLGSSKNSQLQQDERLQGLIKRFWHQGYSGKEMLELLRDHEGYPELTERALKELRLRMNLRLRNATAEQLEDGAEKALQLVSEFLENGQSLTA